MNLKNKPDLFTECFSLYLYLLRFGYESDAIFTFLRNILSIIQEGNAVTLEIINKELELRNQALIKVNDFMFKSILKIGEKHFNWKINSQSIN